MQKVLKKFCIFKYATTTKTVKKHECKCEYIHFVANMILLELKIKVSLDLTLKCYKY